MKWDRIDPTDSQWWTKTLSKGLEIQSAIDSLGKNFWILSTFDDGTIHAGTILRVEDATVFLIVKGLSTQVAVRKLASMTHDTAAIKEWVELPDEVSREKFVKEWSRRGSFKLKPGWGD
jgi:hypothetical protein